MLELPDQIPLDAASGVVSLFRDGTWKTTKQRDFGKCCWNVTGYGLGVGLKNQDFTPIGEGIPPANLGEACDCLELAYREITTPQAVGVFPIVPIILSALIQQALAYLKELLDRK